MALKEAGDDPADWPSSRCLSVWPCGQFAGTPRPLPSRPGGAAWLNGRHDGQRRGRGDGPGTALAAARWPSAAISAAWRTGKPTYPASLLLICRAVPPIVGAGLVLPRKTVRRSRALLAHRRVAGLLSSLPAQTVLTGTGEPGRVSGLPAGRSTSCPGTVGGRRMTLPARITATPQPGSPTRRPLRAHLTANPGQLRSAGLRSRRCGTRRHHSTSAQGL